MSSKESTKNMKLSAEDMEANRKKRDQLIQKYMKESEYMKKHREEREQQKK